MQIVVSARHTELGKRERAAIDEKVGRIGSKYLPMDVADVHFYEEKNPRISDKEICEITIEGHGHHVRGKASGPDHITALDKAVDKVERNLRRLKSKIQTKRDRNTVTRKDLRNGAAQEIAPELIEEVVSPSSDNLTDPVDFPFEIVKSKKVERMVLSPIDAAQRMELIDHDFYFFTNEDTSRSAVVYRRADGNVGLIDEAG